MHSSLVIHQGALPALAALLITLGLASPAAHAQTSGTAATDESSLQEVVVTANKRAEDVKEVPVSIGVVDGQEIVDLHIDALLVFAKDEPFRQRPIEDAVGPWRFLKTVMRKTPPTLACGFNVTGVARFAGRHYRICPPNFARGQPFEFSGFGPHGEPANQVLNLGTARPRQLPGAAV